LCRSKRSTPPTLDATPENILDGLTVTDPAYTFLWTFNGEPISPDSSATPHLLTVNAAGTYQVEVQITYQDPAQTCNYIASVDYIAVSAPQFEVQVVEESFFSSGLYTVNVNAVTGADDGPYEFSLDDGPFFAQTQNANPFFTFTDGKSYHHR